MRHDDHIIFAVVAFRTLLISFLIMFLVSVLLLKHIDIKEQNTKTFFAYENSNIETVHKG